MSSCKSPDFTIHLICTPLHTGVPSQISEPCLQGTSCSKYNFFSLCKGRRVGICCQGFEWSNRLYCRAVLRSRGTAPCDDEDTALPLYQPQAPCSLSLVGRPWSCCSLLPLSKQDNLETVFMGWMEISVEKRYYIAYQSFTSDLSMFVVSIWDYSQCWY